jgi:hypothetical protein
MDNAEYMESRVEPVDFFRAPTNIQEGGRACSICGQDILPDEQVALTDDDQYLHRGCFECRMEDQQG